MGATWVFLEINGERERLHEPLEEDAAEQLVLAVAQGKVELSEITVALRDFSL